MIRSIAALPLALLLACPVAPDDDDDDATGDDWTLLLVNDSAITITTVTQRSCASSGEWTELPVRAGGIAPGDEQSFGLPTPSCFDLAIEGGGCFYETTTGSLELGDQVTVTVRDEDILCVGG